MRKVVAGLAVMLICSTANAALVFSVDGVVDPPAVRWMPSDIVTMGIVGDGQSPEETYFMGVGIGSAASMDISQAGDNVYWIDEPGAAEAMGLQNPFVGIDLFAGLPPFEPLLGTVVDNILLHCDGQGDMFIYLFSWDFDDPVLMDVQYIYEYPEPATILLLGVGGMAVARSRRRG